MKIVIGRHGKVWLKKYRTYTLLTIAETGLLNAKIKEGEIKFHRTKTLKND
jgi:hypothetical protein